jgi:hypothetical protein
MNDTTRLIVFGILFGLGTFLVILGSFVHMAMVGELNRKLPDEAQIGYFGGHIGKLLRVRREYLRLYPNGRLLRQFELSAAIGLIFCAAGVAVLFRFVS